MVFLNAFGSVASLLIIVLLGYYLARIGWFDIGTKKMIPKFLTNVAIPPFLAYTILTNFPENYGNLFLAVGVPFLIIASMFLCAYVLGKIIRVNKSNFGLFCASIANSNTIFIGIPVNMALFGPESLSFVLFYYFASMVFFWTIGNYFISRDATGGDIAIVAKRERGFQWKKIISPPIIGFLVGVSILMLDIELPAFIMNTISLIGQLVTPLALIFIGITLENTGLANLRPNRDLTIALIGRLLGAPFLAYLIVPIFDLPKLMGNVYIIQSALPVVMQIPILSAYYNTNPRFGAVVVTLSTLLCALTVPVWMVLLN